MSDREQEGSAGVSRREFLKISGIAAASMPLIAGPAVLKVAGEDVAIHGPDKTPITLNVNGKNYSAQIEPRVTLLDALRQDFDLPGTPIRLTLREKKNPYAKRKAAKR